MDNFVSQHEGEIFKALYLNDSVEKLCRTRQEAFEKC